MKIAERKLCNQKFDVCAQIKCQWQMKELVKFAGAGFYATPHMLIEDQLIEKAKAFSHFI